MKRSPILRKPARPRAATRLQRSVRRLKRSEGGVTSSEYASLLAVVIIAVMVSIMAFGGNLTERYGETSSALALVGGYYGGGDGGFNDYGGKGSGTGGGNRGGKGPGKGSGKGGGNGRGKDGGKGGGRD